MMIKSLPIPHNNLGAFIMIIPLHFTLISVYENVHWYLFYVRLLFGRPVHMFYQFVDRIYYLAIKGNVVCMELY